MSSLPISPSKTEPTTAGAYFVSNYPPYAYWGSEHVADALAALERPPAAGTPLGLYFHIPFCRKRCHFCYFKVYTDRNASEVQDYLDAAVQELRMYAGKPFIGGRKPAFLYFGGGTPSFLSTRQLGGLVREMQQLLPWDEAEEVAFECEPGTLTEEKMRIVRDLGMTRLSLGVENFNEEILRINGRAHGAKDIDRAYSYARSIGFPQINIDLIAGMMGETEENWQDCIRRTIELAPDSVTIYQIEIPYNTTIFKEMKSRGEQVAPVADWPQKRAWVDSAFRQLERAGYHISSAYTAVRDPAKTKFLYRDLLWRGADLLGFGVASFSHIGGTHFQNEHDLGPYLARVRKGELPIYRALTPNADERMIREFILQLKLGRVETEYFRNKFSVDPSERFQGTLRKMESDGYLELKPGAVELKREGLLQVDRLLHEFFLPEHRNGKPN